MTGAPGAARIEVRGLVKTFPGVVALERVSLVVRAGEIHALLGENGAGKSTLGKIVSGVYEADAGSIHLDGSELAPLDEVKAGALGIGIVHQEGSLVPQLSVAENVFAGRQPTLMFGRVDRRAMREAAAGLLAETGRGDRPEAAGGRTVDGPAAGGGDRQGALAGSPCPDPGRAHRGADPVRDRAAVPGRGGASRPRAYRSSTYRTAWRRFSRCAIGSPC